MVHARGTVAPLLDVMADFHFGKYSSELTYGLGDGELSFSHRLDRDLPVKVVMCQLTSTSLSQVSRSTSQQVVLRDATRALAGRYRCEVSADAPSFHTQVRSAFIHVVELPPEKPTIKAEKGWYASGDSLRAQCTSPPADPPANLTWLLNGRDIQGKPVIQQRILPSPVVSIDAPHQGRSTAPPGDENNNIIFSPWKAFGPFVDTIQDGELLPSQDSVVLPTPRHQFTPLDDDVTDPIPTAETSNKVASISQLSFMVRPDSFERGQLRLTCISTVHSVYSERAELVINEERPQIASVLGTRDGASGNNSPPAAAGAGRNHSVSSWSLPYTGSLALTGWTASRCDWIVNYSLLCSHIHGPSCEALEQLKQTA
ncbi:hypothetical protein evm_006063 [Chilo suppressalis]|nr:hypothetical protein evm_006063 [Chilo suppressalis]